MNYVLPFNLEAIPFPKKELNTWLKESIPEMKPNRFINIWKKIHSLNLSQEEIGILRGYLQEEVNKNQAYNYYFIMYLLENFKKEA